MINKLVQGIHYYFNNKGLMVFTERYLKERGSCCKNHCKHCPYGFSKYVGKNDTTNKK